MPYAKPTWGALKSELATRLDVPLSTTSFWTTAEIELLLSEALRTLGAVAGFWRERGTVGLTTATPFYRLDTGLSSSLLTPTITDRDLIQQLQFALLESTSSQTSWTGTSMFTYQDLVNAIQNRRNQFLADTGCFLTRTTQSVASPPIGRQTLAGDIIAVRRVAWTGIAPIAYTTPMWATDERQLTAAGSSWNVDAGQPEAWSVLAAPPITLQLAPPPTDNGTLDMLVVLSKTFTPATSATTLEVPDNLSPAIKWGALADLLSRDGPARDLARAAFAEARYQQFVAIALHLPCVIHAEVNGASTIPISLQELDSSTPLWQNSSGVPEDVALAGWNMMAVNPLPDAANPSSVVLDVVRNAPIPAIDAAAVQIGEEQVDMLVDYAEHLALFKVGGAEWASTQQQAQNFLKQAVAFNRRLTATTQAALSAAFSSQKEASDRPFALMGGS